MEDAREEARRARTERSGNRRIGGGGNERAGASCRPVARREPNPTEVRRFCIRDRTPAIAPPPLHNKTTRARVSPRKPDTGLLFFFFFFFFFPSSRRPEAADFPSARKKFFRIGKKVTSIPVNFPLFLRSIFHS